MRCVSSDNVPFAGPPARRAVEPEAILARAEQSHLICINRPRARLPHGAAMEPTTPHPLAELVEKYDRPVPRYTSYPTAAQFRNDISPETVGKWLGRLDPREAVSVYIHLPFCPSLCWYCGCNMKVTHSRTLMHDYLAGLRDEIRIAAGRLPRRMKVSCIHLGGGTPTYYSDEDLAALLGVVREGFDVLPDAEVSLEIDPRRFEPGMASALRSAGFTRASLGVQDTNPEVQEAIGRHQSMAQTASAFGSLREAGICALNADLIYGLPLQTADSITRTAAEIAELRPSRIALYGYAHVPWMKPHQKLLERHPIPTGMARMELFGLAAGALAGQGYVPVGIDHFALPGDALVAAAAQNRLHRNFMGYTTETARTILGFGVSAISSFPWGYAQNTTAIKDYLHHVRRKNIPLWKGIALSTEDMCAGRIIESLLCRFEADIPAISEEFGLQAGKVRIHAFNLNQMMADGLVTGDRRETLRITPKGRPFARVVASCFDIYLKRGEQRHSRL